MTLRSWIRGVSIAIAGLLLLAPVGSGAFVGAGGAVIDGGPPVDGGATTVDGGVLDDEFDDSTVEPITDSTVDPITQCFAGEGYPLVIGDPPATIDSLVHLSVFTDPNNGDEFGVELGGMLEEERIVTLAAGVRLSRAGLVATGVNPFAAFDILYTYELRLPMFDGAVGQTSYEEDDPPVSAATGAVPC